MTPLDRLRASLPADPSDTGPVPVMAGDLRAVIPSRRSQVVTAAVLAGLFALGRWSAR